jgi:two-component system, OmpR family, sensor histidine kinase KdpD
MHNMADDNRPNPDQLLARLQAEESRARRGKLHIFFGYAAGVGKTYAMLEAAQREVKQGTEVVVGYVEPHGRPETEALLHGLESLPHQQLPYRGVTLREFDLDAALARHPQLILVDELAHTNVEGSRHTKRWQDVEELLENGIDVWTTLNVQHIESLNDVIAQITGVTVRETLPDAVLERADEIELVDVTPEELMERLEAGKVYLPSQAERALKNFFQKGNLVALRELSLRQAASRLHQDVEAARQDRAAVAPWASGERLLVCVGPSPSSARIIRTAKRMASAFAAQWMAVAVNTARAGPNAAKAHELTARNLHLAEELGAEAHTLIGDNVAETVLDYARSRNVTKIIAGKTAQPRLKRLFRRTVVDELLEHSGDIDVYVITGEEGDRPLRAPAVLAPRKAPNIRHYLYTLAIVALCAALGSLTEALRVREDKSNIVMIFLAGIVLVASRFGRGPAIVAAIASVLTFDFFFIPPYYKFAVSDSEYLITFAVMLGIGLLISELTARLRSQLSASQQQEHRTAQLFRMTRQLSELSGTDFLLQTAGRQVAELFGGEVVIYLREPNGSFALRLGHKTSIAKEPINEVVAQWTAENEKIAGLKTDTLPNATALFVPLVGSQQTVGALGVRPADLDRFSDPEQRRLLETCASMIALSIERDRSVLDAQEAQIQVQTEQMRNSLLSSVSHDLRTPLAAIAGTANNLLENRGRQSPESLDDMLRTLVGESHNLVRLVDNLLDMARLDAGSLTVNRQWHVLEELVGSALARLKRELENHTIQVHIPADFPLIYVDGFLLEQVFVNLLENASRYTPPGSAIDISAATVGKQTEIRFADNGPGLVPGSESQIFEKFFRGGKTSPDSRRGVGLGLAICKSIVQLLGGRISAANRPRGGAEFTISLTCDRQAPQLAVEHAAASIAS